VPGLMRRTAPADTGFVNPRLRTLACAGTLAALALTAPAAVAGSTVTSFTNGLIPPGEPRNVASGPDGAVYVTDDYAGAVYRVAPPGGTGNS